MELGVDTIMSHIKWEKRFLNDIIERLKEEKRIFIENDILKLTDEGRQYAIKSYEEIGSEF